MMASERYGVTETTGPHAPDDPRDPYGIFADIGGVDEFLETHDADTIAGALAHAEQMPSSTDFDDRRRCPVCYTHRWRPKRKGSAGQRTPQRREEDLRCANAHHFDTPAASPAAWREQHRDELAAAATHAEALLREVER